MTGSVTDTLMAGMGVAPLGGIMLLPGGDINIALTNFPVDPADEEEWSQAADMVAFLTHCLSRHDWWDEWIYHEEKDREEVFNELEKIDREIMRSKLTVLKGGLDDKLSKSIGKKADSGKDGDSHTHTLINTPSHHNNSDNSFANE